MHYCARKLHLNNDWTFACKSTYCSLLSGFYKQLPEPLSTEECRRLQYRRQSDSIKKRVKQNFMNICEAQVSENVKQWLRMPTFDSRQWEDEELLLLLQQMYLDYDFCSKFAIDINTLRNFLYEAYKNYNDVPFHNFRHCFCVAQMMYAITWAVDLPSKIGDLEVLILLTSSICHDLDHPGYNNIYQINAKTELAIRYNDISPLENHHCSVAFRILENEDCNIFKSFTNEDFKTVREGMIRSILATDMARHNEILLQFREMIPDFDYSNKAHVNLLCMVLIKVSDISNEARPMEVAEPWLDRLLQEFFKQSDAEKLEGLPVTPFMDREKITKPSSQCSFIGFVLLPLFEALGDLLTELQDFIVQPVRDALDYYRRLNEASKEERLQRKSIVSELLDVNQLPSSQSSESNNTVTALSKSSSNTSVKIRKSLSFQQNRSRSRSTEEDIDMNEEAVILNNDESSLADVVEDNESGESETATEVEVSEKTLKFKISTECPVAASGTGRKSYPGSRKGSRERVQNLNSSDIARMMQKGKLSRTGALSFDQQCLSSHRSKYSFDSPEFFDEYGITQKRFLRDSAGDGDMDGGEVSECVVSKETLNLNKRNSEHSVKVPANVDEKRSILKNSEKSSPVKDNEVKCEENGKPVNHESSKKNFLIKTLVRQTTISKTSDVNSIAVEKGGDVNTDVLSDSENSTKNNRSLLQRFKNFADKFSMSVDKDPTKSKKIISLKNNNRTAVRNKWKSLRDKFRTTLASIPKPKFRDPKIHDYTGEWKYFQNLLFLNDQLAPRKSKGNFPKNDDEDILDQSSQLLQGENDEDDVSDQAVEDIIQCPLQHPEYLDSQPSSIMPASSRASSSATNYSKKHVAKEDVGQALVQIGKQKLEFLEQKRNKTNEDLNFFKSLLPDVKTFSAYDKLEYRMRIMKVTLFYVA
ncbi:cyclic nucleotide phosphodiesterase [Holotrichia oblita]|uniref:Cyclic nucleotide phosphodiesterase n=1 Tax=Holotrichia oblita TaxID=644536 RepID=A0ACB9TG58_HOLOL|nr:cyclic nucleotide phosphodiesterase [Holotrichia oblita]